MANCNKLFQMFNGELNITSTKKTALLTSANAVKTQIKNYFKANHPEYTPLFAYQGSYKLNTMIRTKKDTCDIDIGVYLKEKPNVVASTIQGHIWDALEKHSGSTPIHKNKCIRVDYASQYNIDIPVYYKANLTDNSVSPKLATKNGGWLDSDPLRFFEWVTNHSNYCEQLVRVIRYLKIWSDTSGKKLPPGVALTVIATDHFVKKDGRDELSLLETAKNIKASLKDVYEIKMKVAPYDDLLEDFKTPERKDYLFEELEKLITEGDKAVNFEKNQLAASKIWYRLLGDRFPEGVDEDVDAKEKLLSEKAKLILSSSAYTDKKANITDNSNSGLKNPSHKNFGG